MHEVGDGGGAQCGRGSVSEGTGSEKGPRCHQGPALLRLLDRDKESEGAEHSASVISVVTEKVPTSEREHAVWAEGASVEGTPTRWKITVNRRAGEVAAQAGGDQVGINGSL